MKLLLADECDDTPDPAQDSDTGSEIVDVDMPSSSSADASPSSSQQSLSSTATPRSKAPVLISGSLDNTIKVWDIETGKAVKTFFGHIEGVWGVAADKMRLVSASHDRTVKVCRAVDRTHWVGLTLFV